MSSKSGTEEDNGGEGNQMKRLKQRSSSVDPIIGLDVSGKLYFCHQSTLTQSSSYFASRFSGRINADIVYQDQYGRNVYFVERCPSTFQHVYSYLISPQEFYLPRFEDDPTLWRKLRCEANYFATDGLLKSLQISYSVEPNPSNQGLLHWLGTKRGNTEYKNPHEIGTVYVGGWVDDNENDDDLARAEYCRQRFVSHRLGVKDVRPTSSTSSGQPDLLALASSVYESVFLQSTLQFCCHARKRLPVVVDFKSAQIRPTHYSMRSIECFGMEGDWNLEGSQDGIAWETLHASRDDQSLNFNEKGTEFRDKLKENRLSFFLEETRLNVDQKVDVIASFAEKYFRHTWKLTPTPTDFYRYFRILGASPITIDSEKSCLHGEGLEFFGDLRDA